MSLKCWLLLITFISAIARASSDAVSSFEDLEFVDDTVSAGAGDTDNNHDDDSITKENIFNVKTLVTINNICIGCSTSS